jgi:hypothetical protein
MYNLLILSGVDDEEVKSIIDQGGFDRIPKRFQKMRNIKR